MMINFDQISRSGEIYALSADKEEIFKILDDIRKENQEFEIDGDEDNDEEVCQKNSLHSVLTIIQNTYKEELILNF